MTTLTLPLSEHIKLPCWKLPSEPKRPTHSKFGENPETEEHKRTCGSTEIVIKIT